jgi:hypothetical protein
MGIKVDPVERLCHNSVLLISGLARAKIMQNGQKIPSWPAIN